MMLHSKHLRGVAKAVFPVFENSNYDILMYFRTNADKSWYSAYVTNFIFI